MTFKEVKSRYDGPGLETAILEFWQENGVFEKTLEQSTGQPLFTFNDGPPTANGKPGIHHVLARAFKDAIPRYKTMRGYHVPRKAGWDTHGLPVEHEIEKEIGIFDKQEIVEKIGIAEFNRRCRESVMRYISDWEKMTDRMGFWVNMDEAYYTLDNDYIESVWYLLKDIWDKGLIYRGYKVVPYDPRIGATLSSHELAQGYREVEDPSIFVRFRVAGEENTSFLVWTTTPWTLPSNLMLAVHPEIDYVYVESDGETFILAEALLAAVLGEREYAVTKTVKGADLLGMRYERLFDYLDSTTTPSESVPGVRGRFRQHRRRHGDRALRAGLRCRRSRAGAGERTAGRPRRGSGWQFRRRRRAGGRPVLQRRRQAADPAAERARPDVPLRALHA